MATSSVLASVRVTVRGSSAMPQIGQSTRLRKHDLRIHGTDPLRLLARRAGTGGSSARLHLGHGPNLDWCTSEIHRTDIDRGVARRCSVHQRKGEVRQLVRLNSHAADRIGDVLIIAAVFSGASAFT